MACSPRSHARASRLSLILAHAAPAGACCGEAAATMPGRTAHANGSTEQSIISTAARHPLAAQRPRRALRLPHRRRAVAAWRHIQSRIRHVDDDRRQPRAHRSARGGAAVARVARLRGRGAGDHWARRTEGTRRRAANKEPPAGTKAPIRRRGPEPANRYILARSPSAYAATPALEQPRLARDGQCLPFHPQLRRVNHLIADHDRPPPLLHVRLSVRLHDAPRLRDLLRCG